ncbi:MAG: TonB-dependent receptor [Acidimicrobiia bacterium]|nr:TonB-dependent receptor [Acidimicrobiia bacterium]
MRGRAIASVVVVGLACLVAPAIAGAQDAASGSIVGVVRDADGAVLPGVTIEAASPALIEKVRTVVTDGEGRYRIIDLRPGVYSVTFTLTGFRTLRREGIELTTGFAATVNADLAVGAFEETITVSGAAPVVDVSNTVQQLVVPREVQQALPLGKHAGVFVAMIPGAMPNNGAVGIDVGGTRGENQQNFVIHGSGGFVQLRDGMFYGLPLGGSNFLSSVNSATTHETTVQTIGGLGAEAQGAGIQVNYVPRDGGNVYSGSLSADLGHRDLQSNNIDADLQARGARQPAAIRRLFDVGGGVGGPVVRDKVWFFASSRYFETSNDSPANWFNKLQGTLFYEPDLSRPGYERNFYSESGLRTTWQVSAKDKVTYQQRLEWSCNCLQGALAGAKSPEAAGDRYYWPQNTTQVSWTRVATSRMLVEARGLALWGDIQRSYIDVGRGPNDPAVFDRVRNFYYGSPGTALAQADALGSQVWGSYQVYGSASYVTGSHNLKVGTQLRRMVLDSQFSINGDVTYNMAGRTPESITYWATPYGTKSRVQQHAVYAQDQWSIQNLTLNLGLRWEYVHGYMPEQRLGAGPWVGERHFEPIKNVPRWTDLNTRVGAAYDLFGDGRTALKASVGRFQIVQAIGTNAFVVATNPVNLMVTSADRTWSDANGDLLPQESELGPLSNALFGRLRRGTTYDPKLLEGFAVAPYSWQGMVAVQHELLTGVALNVGYFRTWHGNFQVTDNLLVGPADYDEYCPVPRTATCRAAAVSGSAGSWTSSPRGSARWTTSSPTRRTTAVRPTCTTASTSR